MGCEAAECVFALRLVQIDVVLEKPQDGLDHTRSNLTGQPLGRVPVIRVFGSTPRGQTACLHVHGVYRYFLVPFDGEPPSDPHALSVQLKALAKELNDALGNGPSMLGHSRERVFLRVAGSWGAARRSLSRRTSLTCCSSRSTTTCSGWTSCA